MTHQVLAVFKNQQDAAMAADRLLAAGVTEPQISVLADDNISPRIGIAAKSAGPEGVATGATIGGALGAIAAGAAAVGTLALPGIGILAGPLVAAIAGAGAGGVAGGAVGGLIGLGIPKHEAESYQKAIREGGILLGVEVGDHEQGPVKDILKDAGGEGVTTH